MNYYVALKFDSLKPSIVEMVSSYDDARALCDIYRRRDLANGRDNRYMILTEANE